MVSYNNLPEVTVLQTRCIAFIRIEMNFRFMAFPGANQYVFKYETSFSSKTDAYHLLIFYARFLSLFGGQMT